MLYGMSQESAIDQIFEPDPRREEEEQLFEEDKRRCLLSMWKVGLASHAFNHGWSDRECVVPGTRKKETNKSLRETWSVTSTAHVLMDCKVLIKKHKYD